MKETRVKGAGRIAKSDYEKLAHFRYQMRRFLRFSEEVTRKQGITALQYLLLLQIKGFPGRECATIGELAERLQAKHHGVVSLVSRCEAAGLVKRNASRDDKRQVQVTLTKEGTRCLAKLARLHRAELRSVQADLAPPDMTAVLTMRQAHATVPSLRNPAKATDDATIDGRVQESRRGH
jgi:DNA-binding MarR family transcriptional regulator